MHTIYNIGIWVYYFAVLVVSPWNRKAAMWISGRRDWKRKIAGKFSQDDRVIWFHCASLGEFEQGRPLISLVRKKHPQYKVLLTFFSPSGYEKRKDYGGADLVAYLPHDTPANARALLELVPVEKAVFIKYELWFNFLKCMKRKDIPVYLASAHFTSSQLFFRWYGRWYRKFLDLFTQIFVQESGSEELLKVHGISHVSVAGDTRFDRVVEISRSAAENPAVAAFAGGDSLVIAGSTWEKDESLIRVAYEALKGKCKWIIAPHEPDAKAILRLKQWFPNHLLYTAIDKDDLTGNADLLIVDTIGHLSSLYRYGSIAVIGGGFGKGIHNILEATAAGLPVIFGPNYHRFREAVELKNAGAAYVAEGPGDGLLHIRALLTNTELLKSRSQTAEKYTFSRTGATEIIVDYVFKSIS